MEATRERQRACFSGTKDIASNADMRPAEVRRYYELDAACTNLMQTAISQLQLSARAYHCMLKLAWTIANLAGSEKLASQDLAEALQYRPRMNEG